MHTELLYEPTEFERLIDEPWNATRVRDRIAAIVADAEAALGLIGNNTLYDGSAGVIWALDVLGSSLDLRAAALRALELERADPDEADDEHHTPGSLLSGEAGVLLTAYRVAPDAQLADDLHALVRANVDNPTDDISWGAPGTLLAALAMHEWTGEQRWLDAARDSATTLRTRRGEDGLWRQDDDYRGFTTLHGAAGNTLALLRQQPDEELARETAGVLARHAVRRDGFVNWPGTPRPTLRRPRDGRVVLQWCTGTPGVISGSWDYLDEDLVLAGARLVWHAGAHRDEKGHGLCHGTSGNGFTLLKAFARTGDELWLERARRFAVHALAQAERMTTRHSLFRGDIGTAFFAAACLDADPRFPIVDVM
jgi:lantibiotic modifying enzyme